MCCYLTVLERQYSVLWRDEESGLKVEQYLISKHELGIGDWQLEINGAFSASKVDS